MLVYEREKLSIESHEAKVACVCIIALELPRCVSLDSDLSPETQ